jgi:hypothetical protein
MVFLELRVGQNQGARTRALAGAQTPARDAGNALSFIRTVTVGPGITPDLLTLLRKAEQALAGLCNGLPSPPVGNSTPP